MRKALLIGLSVMSLVGPLLAAEAYAGRCDGNQGNGKGNICAPSEPVKTGNAAEAHRPGKDLHDVYEYAKEVHGYANGNSEAIKWHGVQINGLKEHKVDKAVFEADQARQDAQVAKKVDKTTFRKDQARQDKHAAEVEAEVDTHTGRLNDHDYQLARHQDALDANAAAMYGLNSRVGGMYRQLADHESRISGLERDMDRANEANAIALAIAGHQFNTRGGFQTAISASTVNGKQALAIGAGGAINERLFLNAGVSQSGSTTGGVVSSTVAW